MHSWVQSAQKSILRRDPICESAAWFFVSILKFIFTSIFEIKIHEKISWHKQNSFSKVDWVKFKFLKITRLSFDLLLYNENSGRFCVTNLRENRLNVKMWLSFKTIITLSEVLMSNFICSNKSYKL